MIINITPANMDEQASDAAQARTADYSSTDSQYTYPDWVLAHVQQARREALSDDNLADMAHLVRAKWDDEAGWSLSIPAATPCGGHILRAMVFGGFISERPTQGANIIDVLTNRMVP